MRCDLGVGAQMSRARALAAVVLCVVATGFRDREAHAEPAEVESLIAKGNELRRRGQADRALPLFQKAYALVHTPRTAGQLGLVEVSVGDLVEAERHLGAALDSPQHPWVAGNRAGLEQMLARARAGIGELVVDGGPPGAAVAVNGVPAGAFPLASAIKVNAGRVDVEVRAPAYATVTRSLHVGGGERQRLSVTLDKVPARTPGPAPTASSAGAPKGGSAVAGGPADVGPPTGAGAVAGNGRPAVAGPSAGPVARASAVGPAVVGPPGGPERSSTQGGGGAEGAAVATSVPAPEASPAVVASGAALGPSPADSSQIVAVAPESQPATSGLRTAAWLFAGGAVLGLGTGLGLQVAARTKFADFDASCELVGNNPTPRSTTSLVTKQDCGDLYDTWNTQKRWSIVGYVAGAALAVTSGVLFWTSRPAATGADLRARVTCAPGPGTILCRGEF